MQGEMMSKTQRSFAILVALALVGCRSTSEPAIQRARADLRSAPTSAVVAGRALHLEADLWRDFMPISPADGKPLVVVARVLADDGKQLPAGIVADSLWVLMGDDAWVTVALEEQARPATGDRIEVVARNGPKWGPGITVDVVLRLRDATGRVTLLRVSSLIGRTD